MVEIEEIFAGKSWIAAETPPSRLISACPMADLAAPLCPLARQQARMKRLSFAMAIKPAISAKAFAKQF